MTPEQLETVAELAESFDKRISDIDARFVTIEGHIADGAKAADEHSKELTNLGDSYKKLADLYVSMDKRFEDMVTTIQNYVSETAGLRQSARQLISEVREKLKDVGT